MTALAAARSGLPPAVPAAIALAWAVAVAAEASGAGAALHHDGIAEGGLPAWAALPLFLVAWQVMVAAMMLPSSLPLVRLFWAAARGGPDAGRSLAAFLGGYGVVWAWLGAAALAGDLALHRVVDAVPAVGQRPWLVSGSVLVLAGAFQFTGLKDRCLHECRHPGAWMLTRYRRGVGEAFRLGSSHGAFCVGCCWALMLLMFAAGFASLLWMAALTAVMVYEKVGRHGRAVTPVVGAALLAGGGVVLGLGAAG